MYVCSVMSDFLQPCGLYSARLLCPWNFPGKNTGVGAISFSMGSSHSRDLTRVSCIGRRTLPPSHQGIPLEIVPESNRHIELMGTYHWTCCWHLPSLPLPYSSAREAFPALPRPPTAWIGCPLYHPLPYPAIMLKRDHKDSISWVCLAWSTAKSLTRKTVCLIPLSLMQCLPMSRHSIN